jgi:hypothetical protein
MNVDALIHVQLPIVTPAQGMENVMGIFGAEPAEHDASLVGDAVAVGILEMKQFRAGGDVGAAVAWEDASWDE